MIKRFFESPNGSFLLESIYTEVYKDFNCFSLKENNIVKIYFENYDLHKSQKEIKNLIYDHNFQKYSIQFEKLLNTADGLCQKYIEQKNYKGIVKLFIKFLHMYKYTESFYTDTLYLILQKKYDDLLKIKINKIEELKNKGRIFLNNTFNGDMSYLSIVSNHINLKYNLFFYSFEELLNDNFDIDISLRLDNHLLFKKSLFNDKSKEFLKYKEIIDKSLGEKIIGIGVSKGVIEGTVYNLSADFTNYNILNNLIAEMPSNSILVSETTSPDLILACHKASGIITNQGGFGSHAAIISRELNIPCIVGTQNATNLLKTGDRIILNANQGVVDKL